MATSVNTQESKDAFRHLTRQLDIVPVWCLNTPITIIGAGAIGSFTALTLAKMGFYEITVIDFDQIEDVNLSSQFYRFKDIGKAKVEALRELVRDFTGVRLRAIFGKYEGQETFPGIVISAVDSMVVRRLIWYRHLEVAATLAVIDPRMGAETAQFYAMRPASEQDRSSYSRSLYSDEEALHEKCTAKATMYCATMLSGLVAKTVKDIASNQPYTRTAVWSIKHSQLNAWPSPLFEEKAAQTEASPVPSSITMADHPADRAQEHA